MLINKWYTGMQDFIHCIYFLTHLILGYIHHQICCSWKFVALHSSTNCGSQTLKYKYDFFFPLTGQLDRKMKGKWNRPQKYRRNVRYNIYHTYFVILLLQVLEQRWGFTGESFSAFHSIWTCPPLSILFTMKLQCTIWCNDIVYRCAPICPMLTQRPWGLVLIIK